MFDVVSLFTIVPTDLAVNIAQKRPQEEYTLEDRAGLEEDEIVMLFKVCLDATFICFKGRYYQQTFGTAMDSPVSLTVANLVIVEIEQMALSTFSITTLFLEAIYR